jgi:uncharacterized protein YycO
MSSTRVTRSSKKTKSNIKVDEVKVHSEPTISLSDQKKKAQAWAEQQVNFVYDFYPFYCNHFLQ